MKRIYLLLVFALVSMSVFAQEVVQDSRRNGYIGASLGLAIPHGDFETDPGLQLNLINFGYLFSENLGITASWYGLVMPVGNATNATIGHAGIMVGPLLSKANATGKLNFDLRPTIGTAVGSVSSNGITVSTSNKLALGLGASMRIACSKYIGVSLNYDYLSTSPEFDSSLPFNMKSSAISVGFNVRLK